MLRIGEIIVLLFVLVVVFSASRMAALGNALGKFVYSFKKAARGKDFVDVKRPSFGPSIRVDPEETIDPKKRT